jgi:hypothetical protein
MTPDSDSAISIDVFVVHAVVGPQFGADQAAHVLQHRLAQRSPRELVGDFLTVHREFPYLAKSS